MLRDENTGRGPPTRYGRQAARNATWGLIGRGATMVIGVAWLCSIPRLMGPDKYGALILIASILDFQLNIGRLGVERTYGRFLPQYSAENAGEAIGQLFGGTSMVLVAWGMLTGGAAGYVAYSLLNSYLVVGEAVLIGATGFVGVTAGIFYALLYGRNRISLSVLQKPIWLASRLVIVAALAIHYGLAGAIVGLLASQVLVATLGLILARPLPLAGIASIDSACLWRHLRFGLLAMFAGLTYPTVLRGGNILLSLAGSPTQQIALFGILVSLVVQAETVLSAPAFWLVPGLSQLVALADQRRAADWLERLCRYQAVIGVLIMAAAMSIGGPLLQLMVGSEYASIGGLLRIPVLALIPLAYRALVDATAVAWGRAHLNAEVWAIVLVALVVGIPLGWTVGGVAGAMWAFVGTAVLSCTYGLARLRRLESIALVRKPAFAALLLASPMALLLWVPMGWIAQAVGLLAFCAYYCAAVAVCRIVDVGEVRELVATARNR